MKNDSFKPHGSMGREISVVGMNGPMGGAPSPRMGMMAYAPSCPAVGMKDQKLRPSSSCGEVLK